MLLMIILNNSDKLNSATHRKELGWFDYGFHFLVRVHGMTEHVETRAKIFKSLYCIF